jgi:hypothetical protein
MWAQLPSWVEGSGDRLGQTSFLGRLLVCELNANKATSMKV